MDWFIRNSKRTCWRFMKPLQGRCQMQRISTHFAGPKATEPEHDRPEQRGAGPAGARPGLLPHEIFFGLFLIITWLRLVFVTGLFSGDALFYLALILANAAAVWIFRSDGSERRWRLGLLFYP